MGKYKHIGDEQRNRTKMSLKEVRESRKKSKKERKKILADKRKRLAEFESWFK